MYYRRFGSVEITKKKKSRGNNESSKSTGKTKLMKKKETNEKQDGEGGKKKGETMPVFPAQTATERTSKQKTNKQNIKRCVTRHTKRGKIGGKSGATTTNNI